MASMARVRADTPSDLVLLLLYANRLQGSRTWSGVTRLQKLAFLATEEPAYQQLVTQHEAPEIHFEAYKMGPFTSELYDAVETLVSFEPALVRATPGDLTGQDDVETARYVEEVDLDSVGRGSPGGPRPTTFELTVPGETVAHRLWEDAPIELTELLQRIVRRFGRVPLRQLLRYVYTEHADKTTRSEIKDQLGLT